MKSFLIATVALFLSCLSASQNKSIDIAENSEAFKSYWYGGKAELNRYELSQSRYGEQRTGEAVLVFVSEDFLLGKQVKYEYGAKENIAPVIKMNASRKFFTGLYPYSIMTSVFTPVDSRPTPKLSCSVQEWCGHTYMQINRTKNKYRVTGHSYFQSEGDESYSIECTTLEDEIRNLIRIDPKTLPLGELRITPSVLSSRLEHRKMNPERASASLKELSEGISVYSIKYLNTRRELDISFETAFPHKIVSWREVSANGGITTAKLTSSIKSDYWNKRFNSDMEWRDSLGLKTRYH